MQVQLCKRLIEIGDHASEASVWGEINLLRFVGQDFYSNSTANNAMLGRFAMLEYGSQSPIGSQLFSGFTDVLLMIIYSSTGEIAARSDD